MSTVDVKDLRRRLAISDQISMTEYKFLMRCIDLALASAKRSTDTEEQICQNLERRDQATRSSDRNR